MSPRVALFFLGGTISMSSADGQAVEPTLGADELLDAIPGLDAVEAELTGETVAREQSGSLTFDHLLTVLKRAQHTAVDGFVLVQGTDTLEESAYLIDLLWDDPRPFVVTGAMRNPTMAGADGPANILAAVRVAAAQVARDLGALVVFADEIHAARFATKSDTSSVATFVSPDAGPLGRVLEGEPHILTRPRRIKAMPRPESITAEVPMLLVGLGQSAEAIKAITDDAEALVVAGLGAGHVPGWWTDAVDTIAARIPIIMTSRVQSGPALTQTYGARGAEVDLQKRGVIMAGYLSPLKARLVACVALAGRLSRDELLDEIKRRGEFR